MAIRSTHGFIGHPIFQTDRFRFTHIKPILTSRPPNLRSKEVGKTIYNSMNLIKVWFMCFWRNASTASPERKDGTTVRVFLWLFYGSLSKTESSLNFLFQPLRAAAIQIWQTYQQHTIPVALKRGHSSFNRTCKINYLFLLLPSSMCGFAEMQNSHSAGKIRTSFFAFYLWNDRHRWVEKSHPTVRLKIVAPTVMFDSESNAP